MPVPHILLAVLIAAVWGFNFVVIRVGLDEMPPLFFSCLRFATASLPFLLFVRPPKVDWRFVVAIGIVLGVVKFSLLFEGMAIGMPAGLASLVLQSQAFFTVLFAAIVLRERPRPLQLAGIAVAAGGILLIASELPAGGTLTGLALSIAAGAAWGVSNLLMKQAKAPDLFALIVWASAVAPVPLLGLSLALEGPAEIGASLQGLSPLGIAAILYIALASTVFGFGAWGWLLKRHAAATVAPFSLLVPIFGMSSAAIFLGEDLTAAKLVAASLVIAGLALVVIRRQPAPQPSLTLPAA